MSPLASECALVVMDSKRHAPFARDLMEALERVEGDEGKLQTYVWRMCGCL